MTTPCDFQIWKDRWTSVSGTLLETAARYDAWAENDPRIRTLQCLLRRLQAFAEGQIHFFLDGLDSAVARPHLEPSKPPDTNAADYPGDYVFDGLLKQVAYDMGVIQQAIAERAPASPTRGALDTADRLAWAALQAAVGAGRLFDGVDSVVTYFEKTPTVRVIPYAKVAIIGIPPSARDVPRDYLSIPHEVGHYVFWRGKVGAAYLRRYMRDAIPDNLTWRYRWVEEIFADVYGAMIGGPAIALSAQDVSRAQAWEKYIEEDGEHPVGILRPHIYTKVLVARRYDVALATGLDTQWAGVRARGRCQDGEQEEQYKFTISSGHQRTIDEAIGFSGSGGSKDYTFLDPSKPVDEVIQTILNLPEVGNVAGWQWAADLTTSDRQTLYETFAAFVASPEPAPPPDPAEWGACPTEGIWEEWFEREYAEVARKTRDGESIPVEEWLPVLRANGWVTKILTSWDEN